MFSKYSLNLSLHLPLQTFFFWTLLLFLLNLLFLFFWGQFHTDVPILVKRKIYNIANNSQIYVSSLYMIKLPKPVKFYHKFKSTFSTCFFSFSFSLFVSTSSFFCFVELTYIFLVFFFVVLSFTQPKKFESSHRHWFYGLETNNSLSTI